MHTLIAHVEASICRRGLLINGDAALMAVSGGADSMVMMRVLHSLAARHRWRFVVAHFNHELRGAASDRDARFVQVVARQLGMECVTGDGDVRGMAKAKGWSLEMAARELRHGFLARTAIRLGLSKVALAHHADDQVELFFIRLLRGTGGGLAGMKWLCTSPFSPAIELIRPVLDVPAPELREFARAESIRFREDRSNRSVDILRNRIRRELIPLLRESYQRGVDRTVLRTMEIVGSETEFVQDAARGWLRGRSPATFASLPVAVQRQCLCAELARLTIAADFELVERLRLNPGVKHSWQAGWLVFDAGACRVSIEGQAARAHVLESCAVKLSGVHGEVSFAGVSLRWRLVKSIPRRPIARVKNRERFDAGMVGANILLRHWHAGDRFQPIGLTRPVKLQNLLTNAKIPAPTRRKLLVAESEGGEILWVEGLRMGEKFKLTGATRVQLEWSWTRPRKLF